LGRPAWVGALHEAPLPVRDGADPAAICVILGDSSGWLAWFSFGDSLREGAIELVAAARTMGIAVSLASGDRRSVVDHAALLAGIEQRMSDASPEAKRAFIAARQREGHVVAMIGDGINDAPSLAQADVSLALAEASALTQWTADIVIVGEDLREAARALAVARRTFRVIRQNLAWALAYNLIAVPLAAAGLLQPLAAAIGMSLSSILVVANAARLAWPAADARGEALVAPARSVLPKVPKWKSSTC
jgi:Cu2+-exporting ATPase